MKNGIKILVIVTLSLQSCVSYKGVKLSALTIDGKNRNGKIVDRYPDYGDGHLDGCIIMAEMRVAIQEKDNFRYITGTLKDVVDGNVLHNARITFKTYDNRELISKSDKDGRFEIASDLAIVSSRVDYVAYRKFYALFR